MIIIIFLNNVMKLENLKNGGTNLTPFGDCLTFFKLPSNTDDKNLT